LDALESAQVKIQSISRRTSLGRRSKLELVDFGIGSLQDPVNLLNEDCHTGQSENIKIVMNI
jgi:hypothetical protein